MKERESECEYVCVGGFAPLAQAEREGRVKRSRRKKKIERERERSMRASVFALI